VAFVKDHSGSFAGALPYIAFMLLAAAILPIVARRPGTAPSESGGRWAHLRLPRRANAH
jgi:MFS transporter, OFA family, oxalate/formate antiporter